VGVVFFTPHQYVVRNLKLNAEAWSMAVVKAGWITD
jgi:hypothetical protein